MYPGPLCLRCIEDGKHVLADHEVVAVVWAGAAAVLDVHKVTKGCERQSCCVCCKIHALLQPRVLVPQIPLIHLADGMR